MFKDMHLGAETLVVSKVGASFKKRLFDGSEKDALFPHHNLEMPSS
jgi:hypothetical protein